MWISQSSPRSLTKGWIDLLRNFSRFPLFWENRSSDVVDRDAHEVLARDSADEQRILWHLVEDNGHVESGHPRRGVDVGDGLGEGTFVFTGIGACRAVQVPQRHVPSYACWPDAVSGGWR